MYAKEKSTVQSPLLENIIYTDETQFLPNISVLWTSHGNEASSEPSGEINDISILANYLWFPQP